MIEEIILGIAGTLGMTTALLLITNTIYEFEIITALWGALFASIAIGLTKYIVQR